LENFVLSVEKTIQKFNMLQNGDTVVLAVSGGADSIAMLYCMSALQKKYNLNLICAHVNHGIRGKDADEDELFVKTTSKSLNINYVSKFVDVPALSCKFKKSEEVIGREERYKFFNEILSDFPNGKIAVAHNKNDFAETVLMKITRGTSLSGLRGIPIINDKVIRPLLETERCEIEEFLKKCNIKFRTDKTNFENIYTRNIIRNNVIKELISINPSFINTCYNNSISFTQDDDFIESCAKEYYKSCVQTVNNKAYIDLKVLNSLHISIKKRIIKNAVLQIKGDTLNLESKHLDILLNLEKTGKKYDIFSHLKAYVDYDKLVLCDQFENNDDYSFNVELDKEYTINNISIKFERITNNDNREPGYMHINGDNVKTITLRNALPGDRFIPSGMKNSKKISRFFIDNKISADKRKTIPLLCINNEIAAIIGYRVSDKFIVNDDTKTIIRISYIINE